MNHSRHLLKFCCATAPTARRKPDDNSDVTIELESKVSNPDMQDEILKEWDKIAARETPSECHFDHA